MGSQDLTAVEDPCFKQDSTRRGMIAADFCRIEEGAYPCCIYRRQKRQLMHATPLSLSCTMSDSSLCLAQVSVVEGKALVWGTEVGEHLSYRMLCAPSTPAAS